MITTTRRTLGLTALAMPFVGRAHAQTAKTITLVAFPVLFQERYTKMVIEPFMAENPDAPRAEGVAAIRRRDPRSGGVQGRHG